jgi:acyl-CoA dehydrogenase
MFADAIESRLKGQCTPANVRAIEQGGSATALAKAFEDAGFFDLLAAEERGGGGVGWHDFHTVVKLCGAYALPIPLAQTMTARLLVRGDEELPAGLITFAPSISRAADGSLHANGVPAGRVSDHVLGAVGDSLVLLSAADGHQIPTGVHGQLAASFRWPKDAGHVLASEVPATDLQPLSALLHAGLLAGAMKRALDLAIGYANDRVQFGKPIGKFQAIQQQLSVMAEHTAAASIAAEAAFSCRTRMPEHSACAVAKARTSEAAQLVASIAHAVHGAIGVTEEYDLQLYTRRLHEWRMTDGSETYWNRVLGRLFIQSDQAHAADLVRTLC